MHAPPGVEDPISAMFDLSDRVAQMAPTVRRMYRYTATILVLWIVIMAIVTLATLGSALFVSVLSILGLVAGVIALGLLRQTDRFFRDFSQRHRILRLMREADPAQRIPQGRTPVERLVRHLAQTNPRVEALLAENPSAARMRVELPTRGRPVPFELVIARPSGVLYRLLGLGDPGFAVLARLGPEAPTVDDLRRLEADVQAASAVLSGAPVLAILIRTQTAPLPEEVYERAVGHPIEYTKGVRRFRAATQILTENPDGTYDMVPHVLGVP